jgi:hypothetical protein
MFACAREAEMKIWFLPVSSATSRRSRAKYHVAPIWRDLRIIRVRKDVEVSQTD